MSGFEYVLPDLGEGIAEAEVVAWLAEVDAPVRAHEPLLVVETDKAQVELPSPVDGVLLERAAAVGGVVKVGSTIARFTSSGGDGGQIAASDLEAAPANGAIPSPPAAAPGQDSPAPRPNGAVAPTVARRPLAAPTVRKLATELGVDLTTVTGTGPGGRVVKADVLQACGSDGGTESAVGVVAAQPETPREATETVDRPEAETDLEVVPIRGLRRTIARKMTRIAQTVPMVSGHQEVDVTELRAQLAELQPQAERQGVRLTWTALFALATVHALREFPQINSWLDFDREELTVHRRIHLGMAASNDDGLVVPVVWDAARMSLLELAAEVDRLGEAARARTATRSELSGSTFTLTNYGAVGGWFGTMMVNTPEVGIVGFGKVVERPLVLNGELAVRTVVPLSSTFDHRVIDGALGARFTGSIAARLESPQLLFLGGRRGDG